MALVLFVALARFHPFFGYALDYNRLWLDVLVGRETDLVARRYEVERYYRTAPHTSIETVEGLLRQALRESDLGRSFLYGSEIARQDFRRGRQILGEIRPKMSPLHEKQYFWHVMPFGTNIEPDRWRSLRQLTSTLSPQEVAVVLCNIAFIKDYFIDRSGISQAEALETEMGVPAELQRYNWLSPESGVVSWPGLAEFGRPAPEFTDRRVVVEGNNVVVTGTRSTGSSNRAFSIKLPEQWPPQCEGRLLLLVRREGGRLEPSEITVTDDWGGVEIRSLEKRLSDGGIRIEVVARNHAAQPRLMLRLSLRPGEKFRAEQFAFRLSGQLPA